MTKEDLNRLFGDPERQITTPDLLAAAHLIHDFCYSRNVSQPCIFYTEHGCMFDEMSPSFWDLSDAESRTADWIDKQYDASARLYTDTDTVK